MHDPEGVLYPHLKRITPVLKTVFERVYISFPQDTRDCQADHAAWVDHDGFFRVVAVPAAAQVGDHLRLLYQAAAQFASPEQIIHLCSMDRVAFALSGPFKDPFILDIQSSV